MKKAKRFVYAFDVLNWIGVKSIVTGKFDAGGLMTLKEARREAKKMGNLSKSPCNVYELVKVKP